MYAENLHKNNTHDGEDLTAHPQKEEIEHSRTVIAQIKRIRIHRHWGQPYVRLCVIFATTALANEVFCSWHTGLFQFA